MTSERDPQRWAKSPAEKVHRLVGPRTSYLIGSLSDQAEPHLCAATNLTVVGNDPTTFCLALWPNWTTTSNIRRTGLFTITLIESRFLQNTLVAGHKYAKIRIPDGISKFAAAQLTPFHGSVDFPPSVEEGVAAIYCRVIRTLDEVSDHVVFLAQAAFALYRADAFDSEQVLQLSRFRPLMQLAGMSFAEPVDLV